MTMKKEKKKYLICVKQTDFQYVEVDAESLAEATMIAHHKDFELHSFFQRQNSTCLFKAHFPFTQGPPICTKPYKLIHRIKLIQLYTVEAFFPLQTDYKQLVHAFF